MKKRLLSFFLSLVLMLALALPVLAAYPDVPEGEWYSEYVRICTEKGIIEGYEDGTFRPTGYLRRSEFIKMLAASAGLTNKRAATGIHWAEKHWIALSEAKLLEGVEIPCTSASLQTVITRGEMAQLISNYLTGVMKESADNIGGARRVIPDYDSIPEKYRIAVGQVYSKGIINGMKDTVGVADGSFCEERSLTRAQAAAVMVRLLDKSYREPVDISNPYTLADAPNGTQPFAIWAAENGLFAGDGASARLGKVLFGDPNKTCFTSEADASGWLKTIEVNVWNIDENGNKVPAKLGVIVHKYLAADVYDIFQIIFEDPEQFPIHTLGGARFSDALRHSWGAAVDVNSWENCEANTAEGRVVISSGAGWWPTTIEKSEWAGQLTEASPYSISVNGSVVAAFKRYGWGWGGRWNGVYRDFMHFSFRPDGG